MGHHDLFLRLDPEFPVSARWATGLFPEQKGQLTDLIMTDFLAAMNFCFHEVIERLYRTAGHKQSGVLPGNNRENAESRSGYSR